MLRACISRMLRQASWWRSVMARVRALVEDEPDESTDEQTIGGLAAPRGTTKVLYPEEALLGEDVAELSPLGSYARTSAGDAAVAGGDGRVRAPRFCLGEGCTNFAA